MKRILSVLTLLAITATGIGATWSSAAKPETTSAPSISDMDARALQRYHTCQPAHWRAYVLHR